MESEKPNCRHLICVQLWVDRGRHLRKRFRVTIWRKNNGNVKYLNHSLEILISLCWLQQAMQHAWKKKSLTTQPSCFTMIPPILHIKGIKVNSLYLKKELYFLRYRAEQPIPARLKTTANRNTDEKREVFLYASLQLQGTPTPVFRRNLLQWLFLIKAFKFFNIWTLVVAFIKILSNAKSDLAEEAEIYVTKMEQSFFPLLNGFCFETATVNVTGNTLWLPFHCSSLSNMP